MRLPNACRYLVHEYRVIAKVVEDDKYLEMTEQQFVARCLKTLNNGSINPARFRQIYFDLMKDAGVSALNSPMKSEPEDNGDHSWEYYVEGKVVPEEEYNTAHTSYYTA
jgi:hypothetical protein